MTICEARVSSSGDLSNSSVCEMQRDVALGDWNSWDVYEAENTAEFTHQQKLHWMVNWTMYGLGGGKGGVWNIVNI